MEKNNENSLIEDLIIPRFNENSSFDYEQLDKDTSNELQQIAIKLSVLNYNFKYKVGEQLSNAQDILSKRGYGCFQQWFESYGLKKAKVYDWIKFYKVYVGNSDKQNELEKLVDSKIYELGKLDEKQQKQVLEEIDLENMSIKEVKKLVKELKNKVNGMRNQDRKSIEEELTPENIKSELKYTKSQIDLLQILYDDEKEKIAKADEIIEKAKAKEDFEKFKSYFDLGLYKIEKNVSAFIKENSEFTYLKEEMQNLSKEEKAKIYQNVEEMKNWVYLMEQALGHRQDLVGDYVFVENENK